MSDRTNEARAGSEHRVIRVLIADDHEMFRAGVAAILARIADVELVADVGTGEQCVDMVDHCRPDVVLMDLKMPGCGGITATQVLTERHPEVKVVVLTMFEDDDSVLAALRAGACGYVLKDADRGALLRAIRAVDSGEVLLGAPVAQQALRHLTVPRPDPGAARRAMPDPALTELTTREREVLELVADGLRNRDIARRLFITEKTVGNHLSNIFAKLQVTGRGQAAARYRRGQ